MLPGWQTTNKSARDHTELSRWGMEDIRTESGMPIGDTVRKLRFYRSGVDLESGFFRNFKKSIDAVR